MSKEYNKRHLTLSPPITTSVTSSSCVLMFFKVIFIADNMDPDQIAELGVHIVCFHEKSSQKPGV